MIQMTLSVKQKYSHRQRKQTYGYQRGQGGRDTLGIWDLQRHTPIYKIDNQPEHTGDHRDRVSNT